MVKIPESNPPIEVVFFGVPFLYLPPRDLRSFRKPRLDFDLWKQVWCGFEAPMYSCVLQRLCKMKPPNMAVYSAWHPESPKTFWK